MAARHTAYVTPELVKFLRVQQRATRVKLARVIGTTPKTIEQWERGERRPTMGQAMKFAAALSVPLGYLWLSKPPKLECPFPRPSWNPHFEFGRFREIEKGGPKAAQSRTAS